MSSRPDERDDCTEGPGLGEFLRSLLRGIPWSERAEQRETLRFGSPAGGLVRIDNSKGRTRVIGEARDDIQVDIQKITRAESENAARQLAASTGVASAEVGLVVP